jgi:hypothetical protein
MGFISPTGLAEHHPLSVMEFHAIAFSWNHGQRFVVAFPLATSVGFAAISTATS